jgi:hypothetical protein
MTFSVNSAAKASNDSHLDIGHGTDNAPRIQLVFVGHNKFDSLEYWSQSQRGNLQGRGAGF